MHETDSPEARFDFESFMDLGVSGMARRMHDAAALALDRINREVASADMSGDTRQQYRAGLRLAEVSEGGFVIELVGMLANLVERGMGPNGIGSYTGGKFDMRPFILKPGTRNLRHTKDGAMYVNVPFAHSIGQIKDFGGQVAAMAARALSATRSDPRGQQPTRWGGRLPGGLGPKKAHWAADALQGLVRMEATYASAVQSTYKTWRRITELGHGHGNDAAWWTKGVEPRGIFDRVHAKMGEILAMVRL